MTTNVMIIVVVYRSDNLYHRNNNNQNNKVLPGDMGGCCSAPLSQQEASDLLNVPDWFS